MLRFLFGCLFLMALAGRLGLPPVAGILGVPLLLLPWRDILRREVRAVRTTARTAVQAARRSRAALAAGIAGVSLAAYLRGAAALRRLVERLDPTAAPAEPPPDLPVPVIADGLSNDEHVVLAEAAAAYARLLGRELPPTVGLVVERRGTTALDRLNEHVAIRLPLPEDGDVATLLPAVRDLVFRALTAPAAVPAAVEVEAPAAGEEAAPVEPGAVTEDTAAVETAAVPAGDGEEGPRGVAREDADPLPPDPIQAIMASLERDA